MQEKKFVIWCRGVCCIMIFFLHYLKRLGLQDYNEYLQPAVPAFLFVSAYLYGEQKKTRCFNISFLMKRWIALSRIFYPFIFIVMLYDILFSAYDPVDILKRFLFEVFYLTNFGYYLPECGHTWFLQRIMECYILIFLVSKFPKFVDTLKINVKLNIGVAAFVILLGLFYRGLGPIHYLFYMAIFIHSEKIRKMCEKNIAWALLLVCVIGYAGIFINYRDSFYYGINLLYFNRCFLGVTIIMACMKFCDKINPPKIIRWISNFSFEIYLAHHLFIYDLPLYVSAFATIALAMVLHVIGNNLVGKINHEFSK